ncbi:MAG: GTP-binding protein [Bacilli bacterium]|nr:GTP-binding protein [Bacilli bacterium]
MKQIDLYIIVGFLGSGKTTLLKHILTHFRDQKIGLIINDFGDQNIDSKLVAHFRQEITEVTNGSLFCSCKSDLFVDKIIEYSKKTLDAIFVEGSGLANPNTIIKILDLIQQKTNGVIHFKGTIGMVDVSTLHKVIHTNMVKNQIIYSDIILLNKTDKVSSSEICDQIALIREYNTSAKIIPTSFSNIPIKEINNLSFMKKERSGYHAMDLTTQEVTLYLSTETIEEMKVLFAELSSYISRAKGFIHEQGKTYFVELDGAHIHMVPYAFDAQPVIVFLSVSKVDLKELLQTKYRAIWNREPLLNIKK